VKLLIKLIFKTWDSDKNGLLELSDLTHADGILEK
jgi:hypothetical protein